MKLSYPLHNNYPVTGTFGPRESIFIPGMGWTLPFHYGIDWGAPTGTPIYAAHEGVVTASGWDYSGYGGGYEIAISHGAYTTWYLHMHKPSALKKGDKVKRGQFLGNVGNTGFSTGSHLHFELHINGTAVDPAPFLRAGDTDDYIHPILEESEEEIMKIIYDVGGTWYLAVFSGNGKWNAVTLPGNSGMGGGGAARAGIPVIKLKDMDALRKVANV